MTPDAIFTAGVKFALEEAPVTTQGEVEATREFLETMRGPVVGLMVQVDKGEVSPPTLAKEFRGLSNTARAFHAMGAGLPGHRPIACDSGCSSCCEQQTFIAASLSESLTILVKLMGMGGLPRLKAALREASGPGVHRCPLLTFDGKCSVHEIKPLVCIGYTSLDAAPCRERKATHPSAVVVGAVADALRGMLVLYTTTRIGVSELSLWPALLAGVEALEVSGSPDRAVKAMARHTTTRFSQGGLHVLQ